MSQKHLTSLDGLRGIALLLVVFYHAFPHRDVGIAGYLSSMSWCGVDVFFVLSGFLITGILYDSQGSPDFYSSFYMRRALRLFPVYIVFIAFVLLFPHRPSGYPWWVDAAFLLYASNIVIFFLPEYQFGVPLSTRHIWSLAVEEQFYLLWPWLVVRLSTRKRILTACLSASAGALILRLICARLPIPDHAFVYFQLPTRADSLLLGGAAAMLYRHPTFMKRHLSKVRVVGILAAATLLAVAFSRHTFFFATPPISTWGYTLLALASASLLLTSISPGSWVGHVLSAPILRFFGRYSYGLYLIHQLPWSYDERYLMPFLSGHLHYLWLAGIANLLIILGGSTALAVLSFHYLERPFIRMKSKFPARYALPRAA